MCTSSVLEKQVILEVGEVRGQSSGTGQSATGHGGPVTEGCLWIQRKEFGL